ncbi:hypothetical protein CYPRO_0925 [Cyclonatronum proteinivorum]|uniref:Uncharacterized protein n=1 Tax=Cyclonatronum proteinivorum TaxID=1457365 RepID=A0A345UIA0_9BACT|nr:hypothetical protein CYPRO_0925 [Cyclonatronum proteinivorum]
MTQGAECFSSVTEKKCTKRLIRAQHIRAKYVFIRGDEVISALYLLRWVYITAGKFFNRMAKPDFISPCKGCVVYTRTNVL